LDTGGKFNYEANKLIALSYFQMRQFDKSSELFSELIKNSANPDDYFNLATSATMNRDIETGKKAFDGAVEWYKKNGTAQNMSVPNMAFYDLIAKNGW
jgi:tetratricopeptide (TPR) repeat protein